MSDKKPELLKVKKPDLSPPAVAMAASLPEIEPESPSDQSLKISYSTNEDGDTSGDHFDHFRVEEETKAPEDLPGGKTGKLDVASGEVFLAPEEFCKIMGGTFALAGGITGIETLANAPALPTADPAFITLYEIAVETPSLHWLIAPESLWMQRVITVGAFAVPVARGTAQELASKRKPKPKPSAQSKPPMSDAMRWDDEFTA